MRRAVVLACVAACGRYGFTELADRDARSGDTGGDAAVTRWTHLAAYQNTTCAERAGTVYCWGDNATGQLATTPGGFAVTPTAIPLPAGTLYSLSIGDRSGCAIVDTELSCWGVLGTPAPQKIPLVATPTMVSVAHDFQCVIAGDALCWGGYNALGQQGTGDTTMRAAPSAVVHTGPAFVAIDTGDDHTCGLDGAGVAWCWGHNDGGAIGIPTTQGASYVPVAQDSTVHTLPQIAGWHTCAIVGTAVKCWGDGTGGELGNGDTASSVAPVVVTGLTSPTAIANGGGPTDYDASCAIDSGVVKCWGNGLYGRLGQGSANSSSVPVAVTGLPATAVELAIGDDHACAALADGSLRCWGRGDLGQLGDGLGSSSLTPVVVKTP